MSTFLVHVPLPEDQPQHAERVVRAAICFLEARGPVERVDLGTFRRGGRGGGAGEVLHLVALTTGGNEDASSRARSLEGVLRASLTAASIRAGDVRVFVQEPA